MPVSEIEPADVGWQAVSLPDRYNHGPMLTSNNKPNNKTSNFNHAPGGNKTLPDPAFAPALLNWYDEGEMRMPWRGSRDPYRIWLSEVMLQQTRVATVESYYKRFLERFPTIESLAAAPLDAVLKSWEGLGYYARARNLHRLAQQVVGELKSQFPSTTEALLQLPGIGRYTAAAIASIAFDQAVAVLDGNVIRVLSRLIDLAEEISQPRIERQLWDLAESLLPSKRPGDYNQALMDLGRTVCVPRRPDCAHCPVQHFCLAFTRNTQALRPVKKKKAPLPTVRAAAAVIRDAEGRLLLTQRPPDGLLGGLWMLPGGNCEPEESDTDCLRRSLRQSFGIEISVADEMASATQTFTHFHLSLRAFACELITDVPQSTTGMNLVWASATESMQFGMGKADRQIVNALADPSKCWQPRLFKAG